MSDGNGALPGGWERARLEELGMLRSKSVDPSKEPEKEFELWSVPSFPSGKPEIQLGAEIGSTKQQVEPDDVLLCKINPRINRVWVVEEERGFDQIASSEWIVFRNGEVDPHFLMHRLREGVFRERLCGDVSGVGGSLTRARPLTVKTLDITIPPLPEQRRIVSKIESLQERSSRARGALGEVGPLLEQFRQSVLRAAFSGRLTADWRAAHPDVEPASELLERIRTERRRHWEEAELAKYEAKGKQPPKNWQDKYKEPEPVGNQSPFSVADGWAWASLDEATYSMRSGNSKTSIKTHTNWPILRSSAVRNGQIDYGDINYMPEDESELSENILTDGDLMVTRLSGSLEYVGVCAIVTGLDGRRIQYPDRLFRLRLSEYVSDEFVSLCFRLRQLRTGLENSAKSSAGHQRISLSDLRSFALPIPPADEQRVIAGMVTKAFESTIGIASAVVSSKSDLTQLDQSILAKAFRGELVPQDPRDEPASVLLERIRATRATAKQSNRPRP